jgi:hypothetical protein
MRGRVVVVLVTLTLLVGCSRMYWGKPGGDLAQFTTDHQLCARASAMPMPRQPGYGIVDVKRYRACLQASDWQRHELTSAAARGGRWFRGVEDEDVVRLDVLPEQVTPFAEPTRPDLLHRPYRAR